MCMKKDIKEIITQMTLEEKAGMCSGKDFWNLKGVARLGIPEIMVTDGPHGLRKQEGKGDHVGLNESVPSTCFPTAVGLASSWDRELISEVGKTLGEECRQEKVGVLLGPGANIKRSPLCGRNFEYFSEDPYLTGEMAANHISGVQSHGIGTSIKHYAANNQEYRRMVIDTIVDERTLREMYLTGFEMAVKQSQPWTVMCAYNKINGEFCSENKYVLTDILKDEWQHEGIVVTDWGAANDRVKGLVAGQELEMPSSGGLNDARIVAAVKDGTLDEKILDCAVERLLTMIFKAEETLKEDFTYDKDAHHAFARKVASESIVLLKNDEDILPLQKDSKIAIIGAFAKTPRYQGSGSSLINPTKLDNAYDEISKLVTDTGNVTYAQGYNVKTATVDQRMIDEAVNVAKDCDFAIIFAGLTDIFESEGFDRKHMKMPDNHNVLIEEISKVNPNVIVVLSNGSPVEMPWLNQAKGVLEGYLGGQAGAGAIADILFGDVNPSGKLAETFPHKLEDNSSFKNFPSGPKTVEYRESVYVGYRYYDAAKKEVLFPFGYGLSYTTFEYSDLQIDKKQINDSETMTVTVKVKNTGKVAGKEVVQLYVKDIESTIFRPEKELKGFEKVSLEPGEEKQISFTLDKRSFAYYNINLKDWHVESGDFEIMIAASVSDVRLSEKVIVESTQEADLTSFDFRKTLPIYYNITPENWEISAEDFEKLYGKPLPLNKILPGEQFTLNSTLGDVKDSGFGKIIWSAMRKGATKGKSNTEDTENNIEDALLLAVMEGLPLRGIATMSNGMVSEATLDGLLLMINGKYLKGICKVIGSLVKRKK